MRHDDDRPAVDFVLSEPEYGADEELVQPPGFPRLRRARLPLLAAASVALMGLVAVAVVHGSSRTPSAAPATVTVSPSPSSPGPSATRSVARGPAAGLGSGYRVACPSGATCSVLLRTSAPVAAAVHDSLPKATKLQTLTTVEHESPGSKMLVRQIIGRIGAARLSIEVRPAGTHDFIGWNETENAQRTVNSATDDVAGRLVSVRIVAPPGYDLGIAAVRRLAADQRLVRLA